ncbi:hypothetical protein A2U01_0092321, partial [Trifolium medium]|nr:hypothetical protein [Trifolium medium]
EIERDIDRDDGEDSGGGGVSPVLDIPTANGGEDSGF